MKILESASRLAVSSVDNDEDMEEYLENLRDTLVECYVSLVHGIKTSGYNAPLA